MLTRLKNTFAEQIRSFHDEEDGMEALQVVIIIAFAAVIMAAIKYKWPQISQWFSQVVDNVIGWQ